MKIFLVGLTFLTTTLTFAQPSKYQFQVEKGLMLEVSHGIEKPISISQDMITHRSCELFLNRDILDLSNRSDKEMLNILERKGYVKFEVASRSDMNKTVNRTDVDVKTSFLYLQIYIDSFVTKRVSSHGWSVQGVIDSIVGKPEAEFRSDSVVLLHKIKIASDYEGRWEVVDSAGGVKFIGDKDTMRWEREGISILKKPTKSYKKSHSNDRHEEANNNILESLTQLPTCVKS